jgi:hypothetical protein
MTRVLALWCVVLSACRAPVVEAVDAGRAAPAPVKAVEPTAAWPAGLVDDLTAIEVRHLDADGGTRSCRLELGADGLWLLRAPRRGEADPDAIARLRLALAEPQLLAPAPNPPPLRADVEVRLAHADGGTRHVSVDLPPPGQPVDVAIDGVGRFRVSGVEMATRLPDPDDFLPPGLWVSAHHDASSVEVKIGKRVYRLEGHGEDWKVVKGKAGKKDLDEVAGVITGRQAAGHPEADAETGLDAPDFLATLCAAAVCRTFRFGHAGGRYYAQGPDADPIELRDNDWKRVLEGP